MMPVVMLIINDNKHTALFIDSFTSTLELLRCQIEHLEVVLFIQMN